MRWTVTLTLTIISVASLSGCQPVEKQAYQAVVSANAFLKSMRSQHPECQSAVSVVCSYLTQATAAKDSLIDAVEIYCAGPDFTGGGKCNPPTKGTPAAIQVEAKLRAAMANYQEIESLLKSAAGIKTTAKLHLSCADPVDQQSCILVEN